MVGEISSAFALVKFILSLLFVRGTSTQLATARYFVKLDAFFFYRIFVRKCNNYFLHASRLLQTSVEARANNQTS